MSTAAGAISALETLLAAQREALLAGDITTLAEMPQRLERAMGILAAARPSAQDIAHLRKIAGRNETLLAAARTGFSQARRLRGSAARHDLTTYDASGRRHADQPVGHTLSRR